MKKLIILLTISLTLALGGCEKEDDIEILNQEDGELTLEDLVGTWVTTEVKVIATGDIYISDEDDPCKTIPYPNEEGREALPYSGLEITHYDQNDYNVFFEENCVGDGTYIIVSPETHFIDETLYLNEDKTSGYNIELENDVLFFEFADTTNPRGLKYTFVKEK